MNVIFPQSISCETESRGWPDCNELQRAWQSIRLWCDHDPAEAGLHGGHREAGPSKAEYEFRANLPGSTTSLPLEEIG